MKTKQQIQNSEFKQTELGEIPRDWDVVKIQDIVKFERGTEPGRGNYNDKAMGIRFLRVADISGNRRDFIYTTSKKIKLCSQNDILIAFDGSPGIVKRGIVGAYSSGIRKVNLIKQNINLEFIYYILQTSYVQETIKEYSAAVTIKHASKSIPHIKIPLPPLQEQKSIAYVLSTVQEAKEKSERTIKSLKELKKSMMKHLFTYGVVPFDELDKVELKETEIGKMPKEWQIKKLGDIANLVMGQSPAGDTYNKEGKGIPFLQGKAEFGATSPTHIKYTSKPSKIAKKGSILLSVRAPVGAINIANIDYCIGRGLASLSMENNLFLFYLLDYFKPSIEKEGTGSTFKAISKPNLKNIRVFLPSSMEQEQISLILSSIDEKIESEENKKEAIEQLFMSLLHNLMTGKVRVKDLNF